VTPGSTAPDASLTTPVIDACAHTIEGRRTSAVAAIALNRVFINASCNRPCRRTNILGFAVDVKYIFQAD
jgi:hypothetical protein